MLMRGANNSMLYIQENETDSFFSSYHILLEKSPDYLRNQTISPANIRRTFLNEIASYRSVLYYRCVIQQTYISAFCSSSEN